jgi:hypothetical protein
MHDSPRIQNLATPLLLTLLASALPAVTGADTPKPTRLTIAVRDGGPAAGAVSAEALDLLLEISVVAAPLI